MTSSDQTGSTALVTGASRGFGRAIASALHAEGAKVIAVARNAQLLDSLNSELGGSLTTVVADVADPVLAGTLIEHAGAKATIRFITGYAAEESDRAGLGIRFVSVLPRLTSATDLGSMAVAAYAHRDGISVEEYLERFGPTLKAEQVGKAAVDLVASPEYTPGSYLLTAAGLSRLT